MTLAAIALAHLENLDAFRKDVEATSACVERIFRKSVEQVRRFAEMDRTCS